MCVLFVANVMKLTEVCSERHNYIQTICNDRSRPYISFWFIHLVASFLFIVCNLLLYNISWIHFLICSQCHMLLALKLDELMWCWFSNQEVVDFLSATGSDSWCLYEQVPEADVTKMMRPIFQLSEIEQLGASQVNIHWLTCP